MSEVFLLSKGLALLHLTRGGAMASGGSMWFWSTDDGSWQPYDEQQNVSLSFARKNHVSSLNLTIRGVDYVVDFQTMTQLNEETRHVRSIHEGFPDAPAPVAEPSDDDSEYEQEDSGDAAASDANGAGGANEEPPPEPLGILYASVAGRKLPARPIALGRHEHAWVLGRGSKSGNSDNSCNVLLEHSSVSRHHAKVRFVRTLGRLEVFVSDLGSSNGTFVRVKGCDKERVPTVGGTRCSPALGGSDSQGSAKSSVTLPEGSSQGVEGGDGGSAVGEARAELPLPSGATLHLGAAKLVWLPPGAEPPTLGNKRSFSPALPLPATNAVPPGDTAQGAVGGGSSVLPRRRMASSKSVNLDIAGSERTSKRPATEAVSSVQSSSKYDVFLSHRQVHLSAPPLFTPRSRHPPRPFLARACPRPKWRHSASGGRAGLLPAALRQAHGEGLPRLPRPP